MAVLSSDSPHYLQALEGFRRAFGGSPPTIDLSRGPARIPAGTRVVVAFGSKAALTSYPPDVRLIYCMAPGLHLTSRQHPGPLGQVPMTPMAEELLAKLKTLQPGLRRLGVVWTSEPVGAYVKELRQAARGAGMELVAERLGGGGDLPETLRRMAGRVDALWLPPDPPLVTPRTIVTLQDFSRAGKVPFYSPTAWLVERGACASVAASFGEVGRTAASAARRFLSAVEPGIFYPGRYEIVVNRKAAEEAGLHIPQEVLDQALIVP